MKKIFLKWQRQTKKLGFLATMMAVSMVAFFMISFPLNAQIPKSTELRGVWLTNIDSDVLFESNRLKQSLRTLQQLNFNTVYPAVWNWGHNRVWLNPFRPEVQQFIQDLIIEIVKNYDIDGIQFDDHFGLPSELGYDAYTTALYKKEHQGKLPPADFKDPEWVNWRANKITDFMKRVFTAIKANKKDCIVSVAPNPQRFSYEYFLADWQKWERMGIIEDLVLQIYRNDLNVFISELEYPEVKQAQTHIPVSIGILSGLKNRTVPMEQIKTQIEKVRERKFAGISFFFYETLWNMSQENPQQRQQTWQKIFPTPTNYPNLLANWKP